MLPLWSWAFAHAEVVDDLAGQILGLLQAIFSFARLRCPSALPFEKTASAAKMYHRCLQVPLASRRSQDSMSLWTRSRRVSLRRWRASGSHALRPRARNSVM